jgi:hypothetical protein
MSWREKEVFQYRSDYSPFFEPGGVGVFDLPVRIANIGHDFAVSFLEA